MFFRRSDKDITAAEIIHTYKRAAVSLALVAVCWFFAWLYARKMGWEEQSLFIPLGCGALSITFFILYNKAKSSSDD